jgi:hypothetical protein
MQTELQVILNKPHAAQQIVLDQMKRFNVLCCGRRWGKSALAVNLLAEPALEGFPTGYFTPTYKLLEGTYKACILALHPVIAKKHDNQFIELITGGVIDFWTLDNPYAGRSRKYKRVVPDEIAFAKNFWETWTEAIRPTLTDLKGDAFFMSTPKGKNDFHKLFIRGKSQEENWMSWQMPTSTNPFIDPAELEDARKDLPELAYSQEYLAEFNDNIANPFGSVHIRQNIYPISTAPVHCYGVDLAKSVDWTVITGLDKAGNVCYFERFQKDWKQTKDSILMLDRSKPILIDSTGVGDAIVEDLQRDLPYMEGFKFTSHSKQQLIEGLVQGVQQRKVTYPDGPIVSELEIFEYTFTSFGVRYSAPQGFHDDCVVSLALAYKALTKNTGVGSYSIV